jgi:hypothetical protein
MKSKLAAIFAVAILALAAAGTAYAAWTATLNFSASVSTGNVDVVFTGGYTRTSNNIVVGFSNAHTISVTVSNLYPGWTGTLYIDIYNAGSLPVKAPTLVADVVSDPDNLDNYLTLVINPGGPTTPFNAGATATISLTLTVDSGAPQSATATYSGTLAFDLYVP